MRKLLKTCTIQAPKEKVMEALIEPLTIMQWSGDQASMDAKEGGMFSLWSGSIHGENLEISSSRIVQKWKEKGWTFYSNVVFTLNEENGTTTIELAHEGIPETSFKSIDEGWDKYYLGAIKSYLET